MVELHVTSEQARSFTLRRQLLLEPAKTPEEVIERLIAVQIQYAASFPQALWSRCPKTKLAWADQQLLKHRTVVKTWCMRSTVHALLLRDFPMMVGAFGDCGWTARLIRYLEKERIMTLQQFEDLQHEILEALDSGPLSRSELHRRVPPLASIPAAGWGLDVKALAYRGKVVFAGAEGSLPRFARTDRWFGNHHQEPMDHEQAVETLLRRYISGYGPGGRVDFRRWTQLPAKQIDKAFRAVAPELIPVRVQGEPNLQYVLPEHEEELRDHGTEMPKVKLLPKFDSITMGFGEKTRFVREKDLARVYRIAAQVEAVVLLKGFVAGAWRIQQKGRTALVTVEPFRKLGIREKAGIEKEAARLGKFLGAKETRLDFADS